MTDASSLVISMNPIGFIRTVMRSKFEAPHQPSDPSAKPGIIELLPDCNYDAALHDLEGFEYIWLVWLAHRNKSWRPKVLPPRGTAKRRGVFATRSPHRPNPIGLTAVPLINVKGRIIEIGECDLIDGTPILDVKPYIPEVDAFPSAKRGWLAEVEEEFLKPPRFRTVLQPLIQEELRWLKDNWNVDFLDRAVQLLERDPNPHRTRRISRIADGNLRMGCGPWRVIFTVQSDTVTLHHIEPGYPYASLFRDGYELIGDRDAQVAFYTTWLKEKIS